MIGLIEIRRLIRRRARLAVAVTSLLAVVAVLATAHAAAPAHHDGHGQGQTTDAVLTCIGVGACALAVAGTAIGVRHVLPRAVWFVGARQPAAILGLTPAAVLSRAGPPGSPSLRVLRL